MQHAEEVLALVQDEIKKAAVTSGTYTFTPPSRSIFSPENLDDKIKLLVPVATPIRAVLPRTEGMGQATGWKMLTSRLDNTAAGTNTSVGFADAGQPNQTTQTYVFKSAAYKNLGRDVEVGRQQIAANRGMTVEDIRAKQEQIKTVEVLLGEENMILNGDSSVDPLAFDGLNKQLVTNVFSGVNYLLASGVGNLAQALFEKGAENPTHYIASSVQTKALSNDLASTGSIQRITIDDQGRAVGGQRLAKLVNPVTGSLIDVVTSRFETSNAHLLTVTDITGENWLEMEDLEPLSIYDVPTANHSVVSRVYEDTVLKVVGEVYQAHQSALATS